MILKKIFLPVLLLTLTACGYDEGYTSNVSKVYVVSGIDGVSIVDTVGNKFRIYEQASLYNAKYKNIESGDVFTK